jgi:hypothetical protein
MLQSFKELKGSRPNWSSANTNQIATQVQRNVEHEFGYQFEVIVGVGDYASKSQFYRFVFAEFFCWFVFFFKNGRVECIAKIGFE